MDASAIDQQELLDSYDYIVVGSGSSGSIIASGLANAGATVLLLEAGLNSLTVPDVWDPNQINCLYGIDKIDWGYKTQNAVGETISYSRAKMTGGCTAHNDMVYTRGAPHDYNTWADKYGCEGWAYEDLVPYFESVESMMGPTTSEQNNYSDAFKAACNAKGIPSNPNYNSGESMFGVSPLQSTINSDNVRVTSFNQYILDQLDKLTNLHVSLFSNVDVLTFDEFNPNQVNGVVFYKNGERYTIGANREVILSAGAINSPAILMRSGIGNATDLSNLGIDVIVDLPGVGQHLMDAIIFLGTWSTTVPITDQPRNEGYLMAWSNMNDNDQPRLCIEMMRGNYSCGESQEELEYHYSISGGAMRQRSLGSVKLASADYQDKPILTLNLLEHPDDLAQAIEAFDLMRSLGNSDELAGIRKEELVPGPNVNTPEEIAEWVRANSSPYSHASCTCRMGGEDAVVGSDLKVLDIQGLRVADTSIMPTITSGHTQGPAFVIGAKAVDLILKG